MKKFQKIFLVLILVLVVALPLTTFAQSTGDFPRCDTTVQNAGDIICRVGTLVRSLIPLLIALGVVYFIWGVITYVIGGDEEAKKKGRTRMLYGIIGFAIIAGLWGIVFLVVNTFGVAANDISQLNMDVLLNQNVQVSTSSSCNLVSNPKFQDLVKYSTCIIGSSVIPLIFALATIMFLWGAVQFLIIGAGDEAKRTRGRQLMIWGIIALTVMLGVWSLVKIVGDTFRLDNTYLPQVKPN